ncbi:hypothetical protein [Aestuariispira insulae]|uniref:Uncharacterized protein n=1 Tax=Aestuariispira insulae TaxID=1461337 RepID=A0A3D9HXX3_9PROT|nr:hypothetical protein [Aestuariispira insulae]RED54270.1 hypothetical protein DFP90_1011073 [Aestuariispira insulae]
MSTANIRRVFLGLAAAVFLQAPGLAQAKLFLSQGTDPRTKKEYSGVAILSEDKRAQLHFQCNPTNSVPRIIFNNLEPLAELSLPFKFFYQIDDNDVYWHYFLVENDPKRGTFYVRHTEIYNERFGVAPEFIDQQTGLVSLAFRGWVDAIHHSLVEEFMEGSFAKVQVVDDKDQPHDFTFDLKGFGKLAKERMDCLEP